tara:strand:+ start:235 stop:441 length:207 start_codon:yes stop_codon:yes gene_type:complete
MIESAFTTEAITLEDFESLGALAFFSAAKLIAREVYRPKISRIFIDFMRSIPVPYIICELKPNWPKKC